MSEEYNVKEVLSDTDARMNKSINVLESEFAKIRTGRASASLVEHIKVDYYGTETPINQLGNISVPESKTILIQPWDVSVIPEIEKAIMKSDLGVTPSNDGKVVRISIPALTEERRKELVKYVDKIAEEYRVAIRQIRKDINNHLKIVEKEQHISEDEIKKTHSKVQDLTDKFIKDINEILAAKEKEILEV